METLSRISKSEEDSTQIPNPFTKYESVDEAKKALDFDAKLPSYIPAGYEFDYTSVMGKSFIQVFYKNGDNEILVRTAKEKGDISGDYDVYKNEETVKSATFRLRFAETTEFPCATGTTANSIFCYADKGLDIAETKDYWEYKIKTGKALPSRIY